MLFLRYNGNPGIQATVFMQDELSEEGELVCHSSKQMSFQ